jgi:hypothetical protein
VTARSVICCDGTQPASDPPAQPRMPCRGAYIARAREPAAGAAEAYAHGWSYLYPSRHLCPACTAAAGTATTVATAQPGP